MQKHYKDPALTRLADDMRESLAIGWHGAYTHWLNDGMFPWDFECAVKHYASLQLIDLRFGPNEKASKRSLPIIFLAPFTPAKHGLQRFHKEDGLISVRRELELVMRQAALRAMMLWQQENWTPDEMVWASAEAACVLVYDHDMRKSLGTLGGGMTEEAFLTTAYGLPRMPCPEAS